MGGKIFPRIRLTSAKVLVEVVAELGNILKRLFSDGKEKVFEYLTKYGYVNFMKVQEHPEWMHSVMRSRNCKHLTV